MRITKNMMMSTVQMNMNRVQRQLFKHQIQIASNKRILAPSDDPIGTSKALSARTSLAKNEQFQRNLNQASSWLMITDSTMTQVHELLSDIQLIATKGATDTFTSDERNGLAKEVTQHLELLVHYSEAEFDGRYIFGGVNTKSTPFETTNGVTDESFTAQFDQPVELDNVHLKNSTVNVTSNDGLTQYAEGTDYTIDTEDGTITALSTGSMVDGQSYLIDYDTSSIISVTENSNGISGDINRQISENLTMKINVSGNEVFTDEINMFNILIDLRKNLERDNLEGIQQAIGDLQTGMDHISGLNGEVGAKMSQIDVTTEFLENEAVFLDDFRATEEEIDIAEAMMKYQAFDVAYEATIATSTKILKNSIVGYI